MRRSYFNRKARRRLSFKGVVFFSCVFFLLFLIFTLIIDAAMKPYTRKAALLQAEDIAGEIINKSVTSILSSGEFTGDTLVTIETDSSGKVSAIKTDAVRINLLKSKTAEKIIDEISKVHDRRLKLPIGAMMDFGLFSPDWPKITLQLTLSGSVNCDIENEFLSAGVNQTLHRMMLIVNAKVYAFLPGNSGFTDVKTSYCIAETVIVGTVPEFLRS